MSHTTLSLVRWLATEGRQVREPARLLDALACQLVVSGVPLERVVWALKTTAGLGVGLTWIAGDFVEERTFPIEEVTSPRYRLSPFQHLFNRGAAIRRRLLDPDLPLDFPVLQELRDDGFTDYLALPIPQFSGLVHATTWATRADFGFSNDDVERIEIAVEILAIVFETMPKPIA